MSIKDSSDVNNQGLVHINTNNMEVISCDNHTKTINVRLLVNATIRFNGFAIAQFIEGADLILTSSKCFNAVILAKLIIKLMRSLNAEMVFSYEELCILRSWLEARMHHCEKERDELIPSPMTRPQREKSEYVHTALKFNADTYIGQKFLLLDLRELLLGEILTVPA